MADLIAQGPQPQMRWRRRLPAKKPVSLGRELGVWSVPWDQRISRAHVELEWDGELLNVRRLPNAGNPLFFNGWETDRCQLRAGEHFVIGETTFTLAEDQVTVTLDSPRPVEEQAFTSQFLQTVRYRNAQQRVEVLGRLPEVIEGATSDSELFIRLVNLLVTGVPTGDAVAIVSADARDPDAPASVLHWDTRRLGGIPFEPSQRLIGEAVQRNASVLHVWGGQDPSQQLPGATTSRNFDWAFCTPVPGEACQGWAIYVAGRLARPESAAGPSDPFDHRDDLKFTELVASVLGSLCKVRRLERQRDQLAPFFAPAVLEALADDPSAVQPREADVTVLFCDLRGFSREAERTGDLLGLLNRVSHALGVMTASILEHEAVFGDFQGDAAMAFWGWPIPQPDAVELACRAALLIRMQFEAAARTPGDPLAGFHMGIGIATGRAVAGKIGTREFVKVTVFGPAVNLASRLEGMTKLVHAPILIDETTARIVRSRVPRDIARSRRVAVVRPYGLATQLVVSELLPPESETSLLTDEQLAAYERALDSMLAGQWSESMELLQQVPARDRVKDFLIGFIVSHNRVPPSNWDGVIQLTSKS